MPTTPEQSDNLLYHNGEFVSAKTPILSVKDQAIVLGQGIFETLVAYSGKPFLPDRHYARLKAGADAMGLEIPSEEGLLDAMLSTLSRNGLEDAGRVRIRITVTGGLSDLRFSNTKGAENLMIETTVAPEISHPAKTITLPFARNDKGALSGLKTINYGENVVAVRMARAAGADEGIYGNTVGNLCEGTWSNVFVCHEGQWITPPLSSGCLPGVSRAHLLDVARAAGISIEEVDLPLSELAHVESAFLTSTLREAQPVSHIDGRELPKPRPETLGKIVSAFRESVESLL